MAEEDIYRSKKRYESFENNLKERVSKPKKDGKRKYYCKNKSNIKYFEQLFDLFAAKDLSYVRRLKVLSTLRNITYVIEKDLKDCKREDINKLVASMHKVQKTPASKRDFIKDMKCIWKWLFPEKDSQGRPDETLAPYVVRHISRKIDRSRDKIRDERFTIEEFEQIVQYFGKDPKIQAYLTLAFESLGRPQELLYTRIKDYQFYDTYAKVWISEHGKEGTGFLQCIDAYPYVAKWYELHPMQHDPNAFFFINQSNRGMYKQMTNNNINKRIRQACKYLGINKRITCYSLKRNGITYRRLRGDSDTQIQHAARWTSTKQLQVYDMSTQEDAMRIELVKRGMINPENAREKIHSPKTRDCQFCGSKNGFSTKFCVGCKRPLDRKHIQQIAKRTEMLMGDDLLEKLFSLDKRLNDVMTDEGVRR